MVKPDYSEDTYSVDFSQKKYSFAFIDIRFAYALTNAKAKLGSVHNTFDLLLTKECEDGLRDVSSTLSASIQV